MVLQGSSASPLTESDDPFRILFERSSDAHFILDQQGILDCNDAAIRILGCTSKDEVLRIHPSQLSPVRQPDGRLSSEKAAEMDGKAQQNGFHRFEWVHRRATGEDFPVEVTLNSVQLHGRPAWIAVWHDLTEIKRKEANLESFQARVRAELQMAANVQQSLLPHKSPFIQGIRTSWLYEPCDELGGDSLNIFTLDEHHVGFYVLDVAGHGVPASLVSVAASQFLSPFSEFSFLRGTSGKRVQESPILCPHEVLSRVNDQFSSNPAFNGFLTLVYGILDTENHELTFASAGHTPVAYQENGKIRFLRDSGLPIGVSTDSEYAVARVDLKRGDRIYLYSDGVTEARTSRGDLFGESRLGSILESAKKDPLDKVLSKTFSAIRSCIPTAQLNDDVTMLGIEIA